MRLQIPEFSRDVGPEGTSVARASPGQVSADTASDPAVSFESSSLSRSRRSATTNCTSEFASLTAVLDILNSAKCSSACRFGVTSVSCNARHFVTEGTASLVANHTSCVAALRSRQEMQECYATIAVRLTGYFDMDMQRQLAAFSTLTSLYLASYSDTEITEKPWSWSMVTGLFEQIPSLASLAVDCEGQHNTVMDVSEAEAIGPQLKRLDLEGCDITHKSGAEQGLFRGLPNLESLYLTSVSFLASDTSPFEGLSGLKSLIILKPPFNSLYGVFDELQSLEVLTLADMRLGHIGAFQRLTQLQRLTLSNCGITSLSGDFLSGNPRLVNFRANNNGLTSIPGELFQGLNSLGIIDLGNNALVGVPAGLLKDASSLTSLYMWVFLQQPCLSS